MKYLLILLMAYVCNLGILEASCYTSPASGPAIANGSLFVSALDGDGFTPKFNLNSDFDYSTGGQLSGLFTGLVPGSYTVYVRTNNTCLKTIVMVVEYALIYTPLYRIQFYDDRNDPSQESFHFRFDIEDSEYAGAVNELDEFGPEPIVLTWRGEAEDSPFKTVISSELTCTLLAKTDHQFIDLFTTDDNRFRGRLFVEVDGDWVLIWVGYLTPQLYSAPYDRKENYYNTFVFTDGLADLATVPLSDDGENTLTSRLSVYDLIQMVLKKTRIELPIWETFTVYDDGMDKGVLDSPLQQLYIDPTVHLNSDGTALGCLEVLDRELLPIGCRLVQSNGHWQIDHIPKKAASTVKTRKYAFGGGTISEDEEVYRVMLRRGVMPAPRYAFVEKTGKMDMCSQAGKLTTVYNLGITENNLLKTGSFEDEDIVNGQLKNFQITKEEPNAVLPSIELISKDNEKTKVLKIAFDPSYVITDFSGEPSATIASSPVHLEFPAEPNSTKIRMSFDVYANTYSEDAYIFFDFTVLFESSEVLYGDMYLSQYGGYRLSPSPPVFVVDGKYVRVYLQNKSWQTITVEFSPIQTLAHSGNMQIIFRASGNLQYEYTDISELAAINTLTGEEALNLQVGINNKRRVFDDSTGIPRILQYSFIVGDNANDGFDYVVPSDRFPSNEYVWKLDSIINNPQNATMVESYMIDNVQLEYLPDGASPDETVEYEYIINARNKLQATIDVVHGDLPTNGNYRSITKGWYSLPDGTPTHRWNQDYPLPSAPFTILQLLQNWYFGHHYAKRWKLSGDFDFDGVLPSITDTIYEVMTGRIYLPMAMEVRLRSRLFRCEMIEILAGEAQVDEGDPDPEVEPPIDVSEHSEEFSDEFS